jgi:predicted DCC family thiol-disulfide oxidoreductase YuxK
MSESQDANPNISQPEDSAGDSSVQNRSRMRPLLIFDGDCGFCRFWVDAWRVKVKDKIDFAPFQEVSGEFPEIAKDEFNRSVQLAMPDGQIFSAANAVFRVLSVDPKSKWMLDLYERNSAFRKITEWFYRLVADNRPLFSMLTQVLWGQAESDYWLARWLFLRLLGLVYLIAFFSLGTQVLGLIGSHGMLPANLFLDLVRQQAGDMRFYFAPTLAWLDSSDTFLQFLCIAGALASCFVTLGIATGAALVICWLFYLSLVTIGGDFLTFQWDGLLLEVGFLSLFLTPWQFAEPPWPFNKKQTSRPPSIAVIWLLRLVLFKLTFMSGAVKLISGDPSYRDLTALTYHWWTQPLPVPLAWYMDKLPLALQKFSCACMFFFELAVPFTIFTPRKIRVLGSLLMIFFQFMIIWTGNYTFFNWLAIAMALLLIDDKAFSRVLPSRLYDAVINAGRLARNTPLRLLWLSPLVAFLLLLAGGKALAIMSGLNPLTLPVLTLNQYLAPWHITNDYGVFAVMTKSRQEIIVQGSDDGESWKTYEFPYKPGDLKRSPPMVAPLQPRLDWQMWFAALGTYQRNPWFTNFMIRLLQGEPDVLKLLQYNPFPDHPPKYVRALLFNYRFSSAQDKQSTGNWWQRSYEDVYFPMISLSSATD